MWVTEAKSSWDFLLFSYSKCLFWSHHGHFRQVLVPWRIVCKLQFLYVLQGAGLANLGNTCYLNSVLQCLTYTEPFAAYLQSGRHKSLCKCCWYCNLTGSTHFVKSQCCIWAVDFRTSCNGTDYYVQLEFKDKPIWYTIVIYWCDTKDKSTSNPSLPWLEWAKAICFYSTAQFHYFFSLDLVQPTQMQSHLIHWKFL